MDDCAMPLRARNALAPLLHRWGKARTTQLIGLWKLLGDGGVSRHVSAPALQVWGPPGAGKSGIVNDYVKTLDIKHIRLNCAAFTSLGELNARMIELLRRAGLAAATADANGVPRALERAAPVGQQVKSLDKLETMLRAPLQVLSSTGSATGSTSKPTVKIVVVLEHSQELPRLGAGAMDFLLNLPEVLQLGNQLSFLTVGRLPLSNLGMFPSREPPSVAFSGYTEAEAEEAIVNVLAGESTTRAVKAGLAIKELCRGLLKFAWPRVGGDIHQLLSVGRQLLFKEGELPADVKTTGWNSDAFQQCVLKAIGRRQGQVDQSGLLKSGQVVKDMDPASSVAQFEVQHMTKAEMRLILAAYVAGYVDKEDDLQLFMPGYKRKAKRKMGSKQGVDEELPVYTKAPSPTSMTRLLAVYHRLARRPHLLGPMIFENLSDLRGQGLLSFAAERACDQDVKVMCRAKLPLVRAIASELNVDLAEYLAKY